jgi:hypothetical protein
MIRPITKVTRGRKVIIAAGLMLAFASIHITPATAALSGVVSYWGDPSSPTEHDASNGPYACGGTWQIDENYAEPLEVYNPCNSRVWVHVKDYTAARTYSYCVNPHGGLDYSAFPWHSGDRSDIQLSSTTSPCDGTAQFIVDWEQGDPSNPTATSVIPVSCGQAGPGSFSTWYIGQLLNYCDSRVWVHEYDSGTGNQFCTDLTTGYSLLGYPSLGKMWQFQETLNQAPCNAGNPPYPW